MKRSYSRNRNSSRNTATTGELKDARASEPSGSMDADSKTDSSNKIKFDIAEKVKGGEQE